MVGLLAFMLRLLTNFILWFILIGAGTFMYCKIKKIPEVGHYIKRIIKIAFVVAFLHSLLVTALIQVSAAADKKQVKKMKTFMGAISTLKIDQYYE